MAEEKKKRKRRPARQDWKPHWIVGLLLKIWMVVFGAVKIALGAVATVVIIVGICALVFAGILGDYLQEDIAPMSGTDLSSFALDLNSYVYCLDSNGNIQKLQDLYAENNREWVDIEDVPEDLIHATIAIEDKRFYEHQGVDWITTMKACFFMFFGNGDRGGSTITQQFIKNWTGDNDVTVQRKVLEIFRATEFEKNYDKDTILEWYLNTIYMGQRRNGVKAAAGVYFGKELEMLTIAECASLISITNNPSLYNPYRENLDAGGLNGAQRNRERQLDVLSEMLSQGWITQEEHDEAVAQEIVFKWGIDDEDRIAQCIAEGCGYRGTVSTFTKEGSQYYCPSCGSETNIGADASQEVYSYYVDTVYEDVAKALAERDGVEWNDDTKAAYQELISRSGYHIYACIDLEVQAQLDAIYTDLEQIPDTRSGQQLQSAMVIIDNVTGDIVAMVGGVGVKDTHDGLNRATDSELQSGSSIKPLSIYAPAFESGDITPATVIKDLPLNYDTGAGWPKNDNRIYNYARSIRQGIVSSVNAVAANTLDIIGCGYAYSFAKDQFGLSTLTQSYVAADGEIMSDEGFAPLAMGAQTIGITVRDMASAYATFANNGVYREGRTFTKVYDSDGNLVLDNTQDSREILSRKTVDYINYCLELAVLRGTGNAADFNGHNVYGKTGTTSSNKDRWFCGYTGHYTAAVWCGYDQPEVIKLVGNSQNPAARLFKKVMQPLHADLERKNLLKGVSFRDVTVCLDSGLLATDACTSDIRLGMSGVAGDFSRVDEAKVYKEDVPKDSCDKHVLVDYCDEGCAAANEYCRLFAEAQEKTLTQKALVKMTQEEIDTMLAAKKYGLEPEYLLDAYIYLINEDGTDGAFKGLDKKLNKDVTSPYITCTVHTQQAWEEYLASQVPEPTEPEATEGTDIPLWPFG